MKLSFGDLEGGQNTYISWWLEVETLCRDEYGSTKEMTMTIHEREWYPSVESD